MKKNVYFLDKKHINRRKNSNEDDWARFKPLDENNYEEENNFQEIPEIPDRVITFNTNNIVKTKEDGYKEKSDEFKDGFSNTAQYLKFVNAHLADKKEYLDKMLESKERFSTDIADLNPNLVTKEYLDTKNYTNLKSDDIRLVLKNLEEEKNLLREKIDHFNNNISKANRELEGKNKQIVDIESALSYKEMINDSGEKRIENEDDAIETIQKELKVVGSKNESEKIFGAINSLVVLLNSKNQATLNELNTVKNEFNKMKQEYKNVMNDLEKKKSKK